MYNISEKTKSLLQNFVISNSDKKVTFKKYTKFNFVLDAIFSGSGQVGDDGYLVLWEQEMLEELNDDYMVETFLNDIFLIGSDGGSNAFGINANGKFIAVPFIGMCDEDVEILADSVDEFIERIANCDY